MAANVMLAICEKKATAVDLYLPLRLYIASAYSERDAATADDDLCAVRDFRAAAVESPSLPDSSALEKRSAALLAYVRALALIEALFPTSPDRAEHPISFTWHDAFSPYEKTSLPSVHLEKAAVLFNVGAVYSQIALAADRTTDVGIGTACDAFQRAAGAFAYLRESGVAAKAVAAGATTADVTPECAWMLEKLMLAQAQECFFEKDIAGGKPPTLCSKVARQVGIFYKQAYAALSAPPLTQHFDNAWVSHVQLKEAQFNAHASYQFSLYLHQKMEIAQEIVCLKIGMNSLADAKKVVKGAAVSLLDSVNKLDFNMKTNLEVAIEENNHVYQMKIPDACSLGELPAASVVNSYSLAKVLDSSKESLFSSLVPDGRMKAFSELLQPRDLGSFLTSNNEDQLNLWAADLKKADGSDTLTEGIKDDALIGALSRENHMCSLLHLASSSRSTSIFDLPYDLFVLILGRIRSPHDLERMRLVCWEWRNSIPSRLGPFLVMSRIDATPLDRVCLLQFEAPNAAVGVVPMLRKAVARILPPAGTVCWGSAHGLMAMAQCPPQESTPFLHCLHCGESLPLPPFAPEMIPRGIFFRAAPLHDHLIIARFPHADKGRLFNDTIDWDDVEAGNQWVICTGFEDIGVTSVGFLPNVLMGVATTRGFLMVDEVSRAINNVEELIMVDIPATEDKAERPWTDNHSHIFVCEGKLYLCLLFDRYPDGAAEQDVHVRVRLYELANDDVNGYHLIQSKQIGPYSVFLGPNQAIVLPAFERSIGRKPNTIYVEDWSSLLRSPRILAVELLTQAVTAIEYPTSVAEEGDVFKPAIWTCSPSEKVVFDHCLSQ